MTEYPSRPDPYSESLYEPPGFGAEPAPSNNHPGLLIAVVILAFLALLALFTMLSLVMPSGVALLFALVASIGIGRWLWENFSVVTRRHRGIPAWLIMGAASLAAMSVFADAPTDSVANQPDRLVADELSDASVDAETLAPTAAPIEPTATSLPSTATPIPIPALALGAQSNFDDALRASPIDDELEFGLLGDVPIQLVNSFDAESRTLTLDADLDIPDAGSSLAPQVEFTLWENIVKSGELGSYTTLLDEVLFDSGVPSSQIDEWNVTAVRFTSSSMSVLCSDLSALAECLEAERPEPAPTALPTPTSTPRPAPAATPVPVPTQAPAAQPTAVPVPTSTPRPAPAATPAPQQVAPPPPAPTANCHPSYTPCVPNSATDLNCDDIGFAVTVIGPDVYGFDGRDNDGLGCESYG